MPPQPSRRWGTVKCLVALALSEPSAWRKAWNFGEFKGDKNGVADISFENFLDEAYFLPDVDLLLKITAPELDSWPVFFWDTSKKGIGTTTCSNFAQIRDAILARDGAEV